MRGRGATATEIEGVYRAHSHAFLRTVTAWLRDGEAALDVVQEGFALALRRRESFRGEASVETWLWRIVLNVARDRQRSVQRQPVIDAFDSESDRRGVETADPAGDVRMSLLALPERQRLVVFLRYYADMSYEQIAESLGVRSGTVAASLHASHAVLRDEMKAVAG